ncbi:MAG: YqaJ viral recombinase family protein [Bacteroidetes bacterium]|nr:YqaJ viral recombinase family protein [Bacteroidota bacterium]
MNKSFRIPDNMLFDGQIPASAAGMELATMKAVESGLSEWQRARLGKITGSCFNRVTRGRGGKGWSQTAETYLYDLIGEWMTMQPASKFTGNRATEWGELWEPQAINEYQFRTGRKVNRGKFYRAEKFRLVGCTPDGVGKRGLEVKCPLSYKNHLRTLISKEIPSEYQDQVNGHMLCTGRKKCDFVSFHPEMKRKEWQMIVIETDWNKLEMEELSDRLFEFETWLISHLDELDIDWRNPNYFN